MGDCLRAGTAIGFRASREHELKFLVKNVFVLFSVMFFYTCKQLLLSYGENPKSLPHLVLDWYRVVTDGQTAKIVLAIAILSVRLSV